MVPIARAFVDPRYRRVVGVTGSQMAKTDTVLNIIGHRVDDDPTPVLYVGPSKNFVETQFEPRLMALIRSAPSLWGKLAKGKRNRKTAKLVSGVSLRLGWAGSATELAGQPAGLALIDERDRMDADVKGEGDPVELVEARGATYPGFVLGVFSTPLVGTVEEETDPATGLTRWKVAEAEHVESPTWKLWQEGTRFEWAWPCPDCGSYFVPRFRLLKWPEKATPAQALRETGMCCPHCGVLIGGERKTEMNDRGMFVAPGQHVTSEGEVVGEPPDTDTASFWVSGLCSPWRSWGQRARAFLAAVRSGEPARVQAVINTGFGELYSVGGEAPAWEAVATLREPYRFDEIPIGGQILTCGVDVQKDRLVYAVRAWGARWSSWLIRHGEIWGDTGEPDIWNDLLSMLSAPIDGRPIRLTLIDSGYRPGDRFKRPENVIYEFCRRYRGVIKPSKGHDKQDRPVRIAKIDVNVKGGTVKTGLDLVHIDTDYLKSWVRQRLDWPSEQPGAWHLPEDATDDYCAQIVSEVRVVKASGRATWLRRGANHYFDCEVLNVAAAHLLQVQNLQPVHVEMVDGRPAAVPPPPQRRTVRARMATR